MSLNDMNARASVPSGFRYRARFSGGLNAGAATGGGGGGATGDTAR